MTGKLWRWVWGGALAMLLVLSTSVDAAGSYTDPQGRFSFMIPDGYTQMTSSSPVQFTSSSPVVGIFNVVAESATPGTSLDQVAAQAPNALSSLFKDYQPIPNSTQTTTLGGQPARSLGGILTVSGVRLRVNQIYAIGNGTFVVFTYGGTEADFATVQQQVAPTIASFRFGSGTSVAAPATLPAVVSTATPVALPATIPAVSTVVVPPVSAVVPAPAFSGAVPSPTFAVPTQPVPTGPTGLPQPPFTPRRLGNG